MSFQPKKTRTVSVAAGCYMKMARRPLAGASLSIHREIRNWTAAGGCPTFSCFVVIPKGSWDVSLRPLNPRFQGAAGGVPTNDVPDHAFPDGHYLGSEGFPKIIPVPMPGPVLSIIAGTKAEYH